MISEKVWRKIKVMNMKVKKIHEVGKQEVVIQNGRKEEAQYSNPY